MFIPTDEQLEVKNRQELDLLIVAPAGCGKTEAMAFRVAGFLERGQIQAPRKILVTTFSNRAKQSITGRLHSYVSPALQTRIEIRNFHGLSERIYRAHAATIGHDPSWEMPRSNWVDEQMRARKLSGADRSATSALLQSIKRQAVDDDELEQQLRSSGNDVALEIELQRRAECRLTYDDVPRLGQLILARGEVAELYRHHFGAVLVDEFQDLTLQQLDIVHQIGYGRTTYAGDLAQGIYGFAGAEPDLVLKAIKEEVSETITFTHSHRSSPAVLDVVNSLAPLTGGSTLTSVDPGRWPGGGLAAVGAHRTVEEEAAYVITVCQQIRAQAPAHRIGILVRVKSRREVVTDALNGTDLSFYQWDDPILDHETAALMKAGLALLTDARCEQTASLSSLLAEATQISLVQDQDTRKALTEAIGWAQDEIEAGTTLAELRSRLKSGTPDDLLTVPGVHLLTAHVGKGLQFDWVFILGLEEGCIPFYLADTDTEIAEEARILSVMASRARHGVFLLRSGLVPDNYGQLRARRRSRFADDIMKANVLSKATAEDWLAQADWDTLRTA